MREVREDLAGYFAVNALPHRADSPRSRLNEAAAWLALGVASLDGICTCCSKSPRGRSEPISRSGPAPREPSNHRLAAKSRREPCHVCGARAPHIPRTSPPYTPPGLRTGVNSRRGNRDEKFVTFLGVCEPGTLGDGRVPRPSAKLELDRHCDRRVRRGSRPDDRTATVAYMAPRTVANGTSRRIHFFLSIVSERLMTKRSRWSSWETGTPLRLLRCRRNRALRSCAQKNNSFHWEPRTNIAID